MVSADNPEPVYVGRFGLMDSAGHQLLIDWRTPTAEPFFGATHANPMGLTRRRRYRWTRGRISDYWDEVFTPDGLEGNAALDDQSAFIASLGSNRSARMRDVLGTIQADQDAIIRAGSSGALSSSTAVPVRVRPSSLCTAPPTSSTPTPGSVTLGAGCCSSVRTSPTWPTLPTSCPASERRVCRPAPCGISSPRERRQRSRPTRTWPASTASANLVEVIEAAVRFYEGPPTKEMAVTTDWADIWLSTDDWAEAFEAPEPVPADGSARADLGAAAHDPDGQVRR